MGNATKQYMGYNKRRIGFKTTHTNKAEWFDDECRTALETGRKARETYMRTRKEATKAVATRKKKLQENMQKQKT